MASSLLREGQKEGIKLVIVTDKVNNSTCGHQLQPTGRGFGIVRSLTSKALRLPASPQIKGHVNFGLGGPQKFCHGPFVPIVFFDYHFSQRFVVGETMSRSGELIGVAAERLKVFTFNLPQRNLVAYHPAHK